MNDTAFETAIAWNRFGLGAKAGDIPPANARNWLIDQLQDYDPAPEAINSRATTLEVLDDYLDYRADRRQMRRESRRNASAEGMEEASMSDGADPAGEQRRSARRGFRQGYVGDIAARGLAATETATPFAERLVHFWSNHFAVSAQKRQIIALVGPHEFDAVRPNIMGSFRSLMRASVLHPAMQLYLDQAQSIGPNSRIGKRSQQRRNREVGINENLAREIMELHTIGVRSGYSQGDVTDFAKALTGWTLAGSRRARRGVEYPDGSAFVGDLHENGERTVMGKTYRNTGSRQALEIMDDLAAHPATARHIATKLARHFAGDEPPESMIARLETAFLESNGNLPSVYRALIKSPEAWVPQPVKFRSPWEWTVAALRAGGRGRLNEENFARLLRELGQLPWSPASPAGYADTSATWAAPDALIRRIEAAEQIARLIPQTDSLVLARQAFPGTLSEHTALALMRAESDGQAMALLLASPEMMRR